MHGCFLCDRHCDTHRGTRRVRQKSLLPPLLKWSHWTPARFMALCSTPQKLQGKGRHRPCIETPPIYCWFVRNKSIYFFKWLFPKSSFLPYLFPESSNNSFPYWTKRNISFLWRDFLVRVYFEHLQLYIFKNSYCLNSGELGHLTHLEAQRQGWLQARSDQSSGSGAPPSSGHRLSLCFALLCERAGFPSDGPVCRKLRSLVHERWRQRDLFSSALTPWN